MSEIVFNHFVHLGYNGESQPEFENALLERLIKIQESVKKGVKNIIIFIDSPYLDTEYEATEIPKNINRRSTFERLVREIIPENDIIQGYMHSLDCQKFMDERRIDDKSIDSIRKRYKKLLGKLKNRGLKENHQHILGGEYKDGCVSAHRDLLMVTSGIYEIKEDSKISLAFPG